MKHQLTPFSVMALLTLLVACGTPSEPTVDQATPQSSLLPDTTSTAAPQPNATQDIIVTPGADFDLASRVFESPELGITVRYPLGWDARLNLEMGGILVVDDFEVFRQGNASAYADAIGVLILALPRESGSADEILKGLPAKLGALPEPNDPVTLEEHAGQEFAWAEYTVTSLGSIAQVHYFLTVTSNGTRAAAALTTVYEDRRDEVRPIYHAIVNSIKLRGP